MTTEMGPPPPRNPRSDSGDPDSSIRPEDSKNMEETSSVIKIFMPPPPPMNPDSSETSTAATDGEPDSTATTAPEENTDRQSSAKSHGAPVPYKIPPWSEAPCHTFYIEVLKDGAIIDQLNIHEKGAYMFGRVDLCDFVLDHPTISRFHAVVQFNKDGDAYLYDLGSTHGTFVNKSEVKKKVYVDLHVGDVIRFGQSSRLYLFQGPTNLMPQETDYKVIREARIREKMRDKEASLRRAKDEAVLADGISWGMGEDAVEEEEDEGDEVTWQTYKGQLTEKQEKTREKVIKRTQKIAHMKKEIDAIRAKDISQGGLTQGQQTQIARNEQRIMQIMEELENLEETLNESIQESIGARTGRISRGKNRATEEDDELLSDDDEFYDRVKKKSSVPKPGENQSIETADTLLDKRDTIMKEIEDKKELLLNERKKSESGTAVEAEAGDSLDAYMSGLSSQLIIDKTMHIEKEITSLQSELDRVSYLLKFADPTGEASKRRALKGQEPKPVKLEKPVLALKKSIPIEVKESIKTGESTDDSKEEIVDPVTKSSTDPAEDKTDNNGFKEKPAVYTVIKPQWLGAVEDKQVKESPTVAEVMNIPESDQFVDYKERKKILNADGDSTAKVNLDAASGLIIRKRKHVEKPEVNSSDRNSENSTSRGTELPVEDAVALLLKHQKGIYAVDNEGNEEFPANSQQEEDKKRPKRVLGPEKPSFLDKGPDYEAWVPPEGQSGDGRTSLNDRYGY